MKPKDPELWSSDIDWLLNCAPSILGLRGTTGAVIACIERGAASSSGDHEHITDEQVGWGERANATARWRRLSKLWQATPSWARGLLEIHYSTRSTWPRGVQGQLGQLANVALALCEPDELRRLLKACEAGRQRDIGPTLRAAERAVRRAHAAFYEVQQSGAERWAAA
jgi:hypothetical protein